MTRVHFLTASATASSSLAMELVCSVNSLVTLRSAVDNGADWIRLDYCIQEATAGLPGASLSPATLVRGIRYAHDRQCKVLLAIDIQAQSSDWRMYRDTLSLATRGGVDAIALSDPALLLHAAAQYPGLHRLYIAKDMDLDYETVEFLRWRLGVDRILLPRILTLAQMARLAANTPVELQVVGFGRQSEIIEAANDGRIQLTQEPPPSCAPSLCATAEVAANDRSYALDQQAGADTLRLLPQLVRLGIRAVQVEASGHAPAHLAPVIRAWRAAVDECLENLDHYSVKPAWVAALSQAAKGARKY